MFFPRFVHYFLWVVSRKNKTAPPIRWYTFLISFSYAQPFAQLIIGTFFDLEKYYSYVETQFPGRRNVFAAFLMFAPSAILIAPLYYHLYLTKSARLKQTNFNELHCGRDIRKSFPAALLLFAVFMLGWLMAVDSFVNPLAGSCASFVLVAGYTFFAKRWLGAKGG